MIILPSYLAIEEEVKEFVNTKLNGFAKESEPGYIIAQLNMAYDNEAEIELCRERG